MIDKDLQKKLVLKLSKENKISILSASKILAENNWDYNKCLRNAPESSESLHIEVKKKTKRSTKKKIKVPQNENMEFISDRYNPNDPHFDWKLYLTNCEKYSKHPKQVPEVKQIGEGYWTMQEIVKYSRENMKRSDNKQSQPFEKLALFNKSHKTNYNSWEELSSLYELTCKDIIEFKDFLSFYHMSKNRYACNSIFQMPAKELKQIKEKAQVIFVLGRNFQINN